MVGATPTPSNRSPSTNTSPTANSNSPLPIRNTVAASYGALGASAYNLAESVFLESISEHLLATAGATVDQHGNRLAPFDVLKLAGAVTTKDLHRRCPDVEQIKILRNCATPAVTQIPDQGVGILQRSFL
jgi:hypothetical protein